MLVEFAGADPVAQMLGKLFDGNLIRHFEAKLEIRWHLGNEAVQVFFMGCAFSF